jgi:hypothetical protein
LKTQIVDPPPGRIELKPESTPNFYFADGIGEQIEIESGF